MEQKRLHEIFETNLNSLMSNEDNHAPSMRYLSTCIGASESYIQKIVNSDSFPSIEKLNAIAEHYEISPWMLLYDYSVHGENMLSVIKLLDQCPDNLFPLISKYIELLIEQNQPNK